MLGGDLIWGKGHRGTYSLPRRRLHPHLDLAEEEIEIRVDGGRIPLLTYREICPVRSIVEGSCCRIPRRTSRCLCEIKGVVCT